jgi:hypothetical protein
VLIIPSSWDFSTGPMRHQNSYSAEADVDDLKPHGDLATQTIFHIRGVRGGTEKVDELFRISASLITRTLPSRRRLCCIHVPPAQHQHCRASLDESPIAGSSYSSPSLPLDTVQTFSHAAIVATRVQPAEEGEKAVLATKSVQWRLHKSQLKPTKNYVQNQKKWRNIGAHGDLREERWGVRRCQS